MLLLVVNPGSISTKVAVYEDDECLGTEEISHAHDRLGPPGSQLELRTRCVRAFMERLGVEPAALAAVAARGGLLGPMAGGTYEVNPAMLRDLAAARRGEHASNLGAPIAAAIAAEGGCRAYIVDPVSVDELLPAARITGWRDLERQSLFHALNSRAVARLAARELGRSYDQVRLVVVHLGSGISVSAHDRGRVVDVSNPNDEGPFATERAGGLPARPLIEAALAGGDLEAELTRRAGLYGYLGTKDAREVERRIADGDERAALVYRAMAYQVAREVGAMVAVLEGQVDAIVLTGGLAYSDYFTTAVVNQVGFLGLVLRYPGSHEMEALARGVWRVLRGLEPARCYEPEGGDTGDPQLC